LKQGVTRRPEAHGAEPIVFQAGADAELVAALASNGTSFAMARAEIGPGDFDDEALKDAFIAMEECYRNGDQSITAIIDRLKSDELKAFIMQKVADGAYVINPERFIVDGVRRVKERALKRRKQRIVARIREYDQERDGDELSLNDLLYEKMYLDGELTRIKEERHGRP